MLKSRLAFLSLVLLPVMAFSQSSRQTHNREVDFFADAQQRIAKLSNGGLSLADLNPNGSPHLIFGKPAQQSPILELSTTPSTEQVQSVAEKAFRTSIAPLLALPIEADVTAQNTLRVGATWHTTFVLSYNGIPVRERYADMNIGAVTGKVVVVNSNLPAAQPNIAGPLVTTEEAIRLIRSAIEQPVQSDIELKQVYVENEAGELRLCYESQVEESDPPHTWRLTVDAASGELIEKKDMLLYEVAPLDPIPLTRGRVTARVHIKSPLDTLISAPLPFTKVTIGTKELTTDSNGYWESTLPAPVQISAKLEGQFHYARRSDAASALVSAKSLLSGNDFEWDASNSDQAERDAFYSVGYARNYIRTLDTALHELDHVLQTNVNLNSTCNAFYSPDSISLNFFHAGGQNCSNTGQIPDVIFHEFGHRVNHARYKTAGKHNLVDGSLGEGFADIISTLMRDDPRIGIGFFTDSTKLLRTCDNKMMWPKDLNTDIHISGEIISGTVWDLRKLIGRAETERLFHMACYQTPDGTGSMSAKSMQKTFTSVLSAFLVTDDDDNDLSNGTPHSTEILQAFAKHGIGLSGFFNVTVDQIADQGESSDSYSAHTLVKYDGPLGALDSKSILLHYSTDDGKTYKMIEMSGADAGNFEGAIPQQPAGSIVRYFVTASTTLEEGTRVYAPDSVTPLAFLVGFSSVFKDDAESDMGWSLGDPLDNATSGLWVREKPIGTKISATEFVQQDTDHSEIGTKCFVTGNAPFDGQSLGTDDVDKGKTTLTSPIIDLSKTFAPVIRYWFYYRNDAGQNPSTAKWLVQLSNDSGKTWKQVQNTAVAYPGWTPYLFRVSSLLTPSAGMKIRFVATDNVASLIEAGVDDIEALTAPEAIQSVVQPLASSQTLSSMTVTPSAVFSGSNVNVSFGAQSSGHLIMRLKNLLGEEVSTAFDGPVPHGLVQTSIRIPSGIPAGVYWLDANLGSERAVRKLIVR